MLADDGSQLDSPILAAAWRLGRGVRSGTRDSEITTTTGHAGIGAAVAAAATGRRHCGAVVQGFGVVGEFSPQQWARREPSWPGPLTHGFADNQHWTLGRITTLIGKLFSVDYTVEGTPKLRRRPG